MRKVITVLWVTSWMFLIGWAFFVRQQIGMEAIMPMKYKMPLVLSFFGPIMIWLLWSLYEDSKRRLNDTIDDKFDINR